MNIGAISHNPDYDRPAINEALFAEWHNMIYGDMNYWSVRERWAHYFNWQQYVRRLR